MSKKTVIIYASTHHKNTYKLVKAISDKHNVDIIDATQQSSADLQNYDVIGLASGVNSGRTATLARRFSHGVTGF